MDLVSAGASVLAFVTLGLKSAQTIHEILSSIKDGTRINRVRQDVQGLQTTLDRLSRCRAVAERRDAALEAKIKTCADDMEAFAKNLVELAIVDTEPRLSRQLKKFKAFLNEKDLTDMGDVIVRHTTALSLHIKALESDILFEVQNGIDGVKQDLSVHQTDQSNIAVQQTSMISTLGEIKDGTQTIQESISAAQLQSAAHASQFIRMFTQLSEQLGALSLAHSSGPRVMEEVPDTPQLTAVTLPEKIPQFSDILEGIRSILAAAQDKEGVIAHDKAKEITDVLITLLQIVMSQKFLDSTAGPTAAYWSWCETCTQRDFADLWESLKVVQGILMSSRRMSVNAPSKAEHPRGVVTRSTWKNRFYDLGFGVISFVSTDRAWEMQKVRSQSNDAIEGTEMRISFVPRHDSTQNLDGFQTVIRQYHYHDGTRNTIPRLSVNHILPFGSRVFDVVRAGDLRGFQEMLKLGTASLRDHDEHGASLLFYANKQPNVCRFLLQHGADVDHFSSSLIEGVDDVAADYATTALTVNFNDDEAEEEELQRINECRKLLLEAGCDPTVQDWSLRERVYEPGVVADIFWDGVPQSMQTLLNHSFGFFTIESIIMPEQNYTPLLAFCRGTLGSFGGCALGSVQGLSILLDRGANIHARDKYGNTCLGLRFMRASFNLYNAAERLAQIRAVAVNLIRRGADVLAVNDDGFSVSEIAYSSHSCGGSAAGDLWDVVLADCGFKVASFRARYGMRRRAKYRHRVGYTRQVFEDLWKDQEHLCPYFDQEEDPDTDEESGAESSSDEGLEEADYASSHEADSNDAGSDGAGSDDADSEGVTSLEATEDGI